MKRFVSAALALVAGVCLFLYLRKPVNADKVAPPVNTGKVSASLSEPKESFPGSEPKVAAPRPAVAAKILYADELASAFSLSPLQVRQLREGLLELGVDLIEAKSMQAVVISNTDTQLVLKTPHILISENDIAEMVADALKDSLGEEKVQSLWNDTNGRKTILSMLEFNAIVAENTYTFTRTRPENPNQIGSLGYAAFDVTRIQSQVIDGVEKKQTSQFNGFAYSRPYQLGLGWTALAKAPQGFFTSKEIKGPESRLKPYPILLHDYATGRTELRNDLAPGSRETLPGN